MLVVGQKLYNAAGDEVIVNEIHDKILEVTIIKTSYVTCNDGNNKMVQKHESRSTYSIDDFGTLLFFREKDLEEWPKYVLDSPDYIFNEANIIIYKTDKYNRIMDLIESQAPKVPMNPKKKVEIIRRYLSKTESIKEEKDFYDKHYKIQEYFARIDFDTKFYIPRYRDFHEGNYHEKFYIGKHVRPEHVDYNIIDWRAPISSMFYDKEKTMFCREDIGVYESEIMLRRRFKFKPNSYQNIYVIDSDLYSEGSMDPFLLEVLEENRENHRIGDIIKSIQSNQNKIIRQETRNNFVVQGCAGSGKTMILLHRLSYLSFNKYLTDLSRVKIITPNSLFNSFIDDLSSDLEIEDIRKITMDDYYSDAINRYLKDYGISIKSSKHRNALFQSSQLIGSKNIGKYEECFTSSYNDYLKDLYNNMFSHFKKRINGSTFKDIITRMYGEKQIYEFRSNNHLLNYLYNLTSGEIARKNNEIEQNIKKLSLSYNLTQRDFNRLSFIKDKLANIKKALNQHLEKYNLLLLLKSIVVDIDEELEFEIGNLIKMFDELNIRLEFKPTGQELANDTDLRNTIQSLGELTNKVRNDLESYLLDYSNQNILKRFFSHQNYNNTIVSNLSLCREKYTEITELIARYTNHMESIDHEINLCKRSMLTEEEKEVVDSSRDLLERRGEFIFNVFSTILGDLKNKKLLSNLNMPYNYIFLKLLNLHYGSLITKDNFIFIDEGQDYSIEEYSLISSINNSNVVLNIFGDINQGLGVSRRIDDWDKLTKLLDFSYFEINENYRNTVQITNFSNN